MEDASIQFYDDDKNYPIEDLINDVAAGTTTIVYVPTPDGWKCDRCDDGFLHTHGTFLPLTPNTPTGER